MKNSTSLLFKFNNLPVSLLAVSALGLLSGVGVRADVLPVAVASGFNVDVIADGPGAASSSAISPDAVAGYGGSGYFFDSTYAMDHAINGAFAFPAGQTVTGANTGNSYTFAPATGDNALGLALPTATNPAALPATGTLSLAPLTGATDLYVLGTSVNGGSTLNYTLSFSSGATATGSFSFSDWSYQSNPTGDVAGLALTNDPNTPNRQLYGVDISVPTADQPLVLNSISFTYTGAQSPESNAYIFAVSQAGGVAAVPEPNTTFLTVAGLSGLVALFAYRRRGLTGHL